MQDSHLGKRRASQGASILMGTMETIPEEPDLLPVGNECWLMSISWCVGL